MNEELDITESLKKLMKAKGIGPQKLSSLTDVPSRFIDALLEGSFEKLPARPYIRGYLFKISNVLGVDNDHLWQIYRSSAESASSGERDTLPTNRFAIKKISPGTVISIAAASLVVLLFAINFNRILGKPTLDISLPETTEEMVIAVNGFVDPNDRLTLNGELIYTDEGGGFEKQVQLEPGINTLEFKVKRYLGREATITKQIIYLSVEEQTKTENDKTQNGTQEEQN